MESNEMLEHIRRAAAKTNHTDPQAITIDTSFQDLAFDSVDAINVAFTLEEQLGIEIPGDDLRNVTNIREFITVLNNAVKVKHGQAGQ